MSRDIYARQLMRQNEGLPCEYCYSEAGHTDNCALINGGSVDKALTISEVLGIDRNAPVLTLTSDDRKLLADMHISL